MFPDLTRDDVLRLETRRLWLRWPRQIDAQAVAHLAGEKDVAHMTATIPHPYTLQDADSFIVAARRANVEGSGLTLAISPKGKPGKLMGLVGFGPRREGSRAGEQAELGFWLGQPYWGEGFMTEAVQAMLDAFFTITAGDDVVASVRVINPNSRRVLEKCGFAYLGSGLRDLPARGGRFPVDDFHLDRRTWTSLKSWRQAGMAPLTGDVGTENDLAIAAE
jgi:RimJ/RimL family protein N-acetyltransferase